MAASGLFSRFGLANPDLATIAGLAAMVGYVHMTAADRTHSKGGTMIRIRVEYDAYNRTFKLRDREFGSVLEDGAIYELAVNLRTEELEEEDILALMRTPMVHA